MDDLISLGTVTDADGRSKPERRDAAANRRLILATAEKLFAEKGVAEVNMADIAEAAGVGKGTLYRRFANKAELSLALMDTQMKEFQESILERLRQMSVQGIPKLQQLDQFLDALVYFVDRHAPLLCEVQRGGLLDGISEGDLQRPHFWQHMTISGLLQAAMDDGELPDDLDVIYIADALLAMLNSNMLRFQQEGRGFSLERISAGLRHMAAALQWRKG
ncbi:MAG: TetR/AcrR family transcriptional regulator [Anaerolineae bacterium]